MSSSQAAPSTRAAPTVSVAIPTRDRADALAARLPELAAQTLDGFELVIIDDGSSDHTAEVARAAAARDPRFRYVALRPALGMPRVLQRCLDEARSDFVAIFHDHDRYEPTILQMLAEALDAMPEAAFAHTGIRLVSPDDRTEVGRHVRHSDFGNRNEIVESFVRTGACPVCASATMVRRSRLPDNPFATNLGLFADVRLWCELSARGRSAYVAQPLVTVHAWTEAESLAKLNWRAMRELTSLRLEFAGRLFADRVASRGPQAAIRLSAAKGRIEFLVRLIRYRARRGPVPEAALIGMPWPLAAGLTAFGAVAHRPNISSPHS